VHDEAITLGNSLEDRLLEAKLSMPPTHPGSVSRAELIDSARTSGCRAVGITAPAGYGKSTLMAQWAASEDRPVAWISFNQFDDDPALLVALLAVAHARVAPSGSGLVAAVGGVGVSVLSRGAPRVAAAFRAMPTPFVLMLDDLHEIQNPACHDVLQIVIAGVPTGSQVVTTSRSEQPHLPRLRASGIGMELTARDLALDVAGAEQIFADAKVSVTPEFAATVTERTEGWPAGLYLAALIADESPEPTAVSGDDPFIADYLYREALTQLPETTQRFLRRTAVLDQLCAPLCDALLQESGSQGMLRSLEASSLFLSPLDRHRKWYRYHALFREFLLGELRRTEPQAEAQLHLRAADWYESNISMAQGVEHLLRTDEQGRAVDAVAALALPTFYAGLATTVDRWFDALGEATIKASPTAALLYGWFLAETSRSKDADRWAVILEAATFDVPAPAGETTFDTGWKLLRSTMCLGGPEQAMNDALQTMADVPVDSVWRDTALCTCAEAHLLIGEVDRARELFAEASAMAGERSNWTVVTLAESELAILAMGDRRWAEASGHLDRSLEVIDANHLDDYALSVLTFVGAGRLALHRGDRHDAERQLGRAMRSRQSLTWALPCLAVRPRLHLAKVYARLGESQSSRQLLSEIDEILTHRPALGTLVHEVSDLRRMLSESEQLVATGSPPLSPAGLRLLPYLQTHLTLREMGERLFVSRNTVNTQVGAIYRKLGVSSRNEAVQQATAIGLLGE
jgi:LuxR family maltose regulon positive regulatory protein